MITFDVSQTSLIRRGHVLHGTGFRFRQKDSFGHGISVKKISCLNGNNVLPRKEGVNALFGAYDNPGGIGCSKSVINARNKIFLSVGGTDFEG